MNVQGANFLSLLSGSEGLGNLQQALFGSNGAETGFASAFLEQLGLLQNGLGANGSPDLTPLQDWVNSAKAGETQLDMQNFAAFFGKDLPSVSKGSQDIDLEDTLQTLAGVLQQLQQLEGGSDSEPLVTTSGIDSDTDDKPQSLTDAEQAILNAELANASGVPITISTPQPELSETLDQSGDEPELSKVLASIQKNTVSTKLDSSIQKNGQADASVGVDDLGADFNRSISAMLARQGADGKPQQDKQNLNLKAESLLNGLESQGDGEGGKTLPGVAADIAKLNQVMRGDSSPAPAQPEMAKHFTDPAWNKELGEKLIWMHKQSIPSAELRLNPEHLGPVLIKIDVSHDQANVAFTAQHLAVKEAIEAAIPKLREMLGGQQLNLVDVNVSQQQSDQRQQPREFFQMASHQNNRQGSEQGMSNEEQPNQAQNLVDEIEAGRAVASNGLLSLFV